MQGEQANVVFLHGDGEGEDAVFTDFDALVNSRKAGNLVSKPFDLSTGKRILFGYVKKEGIGIVFSISHKGQRKAVIARVERKYALLRPQPFSAGERC